MAGPSQRRARSQYFWPPRLTHGTGSHACCSRHAIRGQARVSGPTTHSEDESSASEGEEDENEESEEGIDADSNGGSSDRPQQEEGEGSPDPWDNGPVTLLAPTPLSVGRPRRALSTRLVDDNGLTRFVGGPGAPQHHQHLPSTAALTRHAIIRASF